MTTQLTTYDPGAVRFIVGGYIVKGFAPGSMIEVERAADNFLPPQVSPDGSQGVRSKTNNKSAIVRCNLLQGCPASFALSKLARRDEQEADGVVAISLLDDRAPDTSFGGTGYIEKPAPAAYEEQARARQWVFRIIDTDMIHGATPGSDVQNGLVAE